MRRPRNVSVFLIIAGFFGCIEDRLTLHDGPVPTREPAMFYEVLSQLTEAASLPQEGDWPDDWGDANYYGPGFFFRYGDAGGNALQIDLAQRTHDHNLKLVRQANGNLGVLMDSVDYVLMSAFGLMEGCFHHPDDAAKEEVDRFLLALNEMGKAFAYYPEDMFTSGYGLGTYGPAAINASMALLNLEYAVNMGGAVQASRVDSALQILEQGRTKGFDEQAGYYRFSSAKDGLFLYPNITQIIAHVRVYQQTGEQLYLDRARDLHAAIQPLRVNGEGRYRSPYSAETMGATTDDYTTFSSQNFMLLGLSLLYQETGDESYREEADAILAFIRTHLLSGGRVLHHWMDGRVAQPSDPEVYCSGCNLQLLYTIWRMEELLGGG